MYKNVKKKRVDYFLVLTTNYGFSTNYLQTRVSLGICSGVARTEL